jgi:hypothetical protein
MGTMTFYHLVKRHTWDAALPGAYCPPEGRLECRAQFEGRIEQGGSRLFKVVAMTVSEWQSRGTA